MAKVRNISDDERFVPLLGQSVASDAVVEVPDDVFSAFSWPETTWAVVTGPAQKTKKES